MYMTETVDDELKSIAIFQMLFILLIYYQYFLNHYCLLSFKEEACH